MANCPYCHAHDMTIKELDKHIKAIHKTELLSR